MSNDESLKETGRCAAAAIVEMVAALECDYDRLEELREERQDWITDADLPVTPERAKQWAIAYPIEAEELAELEDAAGECESREDAETRIQEDALSVEVRGAWHTLGEPEILTDFNILLSTGGPATRIRGEIDQHGEPSRAWLEVQDWGTPWTQYFDIEQDTLLTYARCFYFGEG